MGSANRTLSCEWTDPVLNWGALRQNHIRTRIFIETLTVRTYEGLSFQAYTLRFSHYYEWKKKKPWAKLEPRNAAPPKISEDATTEGG